MEKELENTRKAIKNLMQTFCIARTHPIQFLSLHISSIMTQFPCKLQCPTSVSLLNWECSWVWSCIHSFLHLEKRHQWVSDCFPNNTSQNTTLTWRNRYLFSLKKTNCSGDVVAHTPGNLTVWFPGNARSLQRLSGNNLLGKDPLKVTN